MAGANAWLAVALAGWALTAALVSRPEAAQHPAHGAAAAAAEPLFVTSPDCMACHNGLVSPGGEDVSIGTSWRSSMMANSARDPYWQAAVRREMLDHPTKAAAIESECALCHMPMAHGEAEAGGRQPRVFAHLPAAGAAGNTRDTALAADGVSCTVCHQISAERLGTPGSFVGRFVLASPRDGIRQMFGPYEVSDAHASVMRSATGVTPAEGAHIRQSELCATCHTLITQALGPGGEVVGALAEQVPYLEWRHSAFAAERSCQSCHMPAVPAPMRISSVLGEERDGLGRHTFLGGNVFMLRMLNRFRTELGVTAPPAELEASAQGTLRQLQADTASVAVADLSVRDGRLAFTAAVTNATGHKFPSGYPSRRAWLHVTVRAGERIVFESGAVRPDGSIAGNDNDADPTRFERHHEEILTPDDVQIYESIMVSGTGTVTTGLLQGTAFIKDNRLLPRGFDKATAGPEIAVRGDARNDADFTGEGDRVRYRVDVGNQAGPYAVTVELLFQPIGFRWADNLRGYDAPEPRRFLGYFEAMAAASSVRVAWATARAN